MAQPADTARALSDSQRAARRQVEEAELHGILRETQRLPRAKHEPLDADRRCTVAS
jgi:hypothetical protein